MSSLSDQMHRDLEVAMMADIFLELLEDGPMTSEDISEIFGRIHSWMLKQGKLRLELRDEIVPKLETMQKAVENLSREWQKTLTQSTRLLKMEQTVKRQAKELNAMKAKLSKNMTTKAPQKKAAMKAMKHMKAMKCKP